MKTPFGFANWSTVIAFLISWALWKLLEYTAFEWGWLSIHDGFAITAIFTVTSWLRVYFMNKHQQKILREKEYWQ